MLHSRMTLALCSLALASSLLAPRPALAAGFAQSWATGGWNYFGVMGNSDADVQAEILFSSKADGHYAILDEFTGAIEKEFPAVYTTTNSAVIGGDIDGDGRSEFVVQSSPDIVPPYFIHVRAAVCRQVAQRATQPLNAACGCPQRTAGWPGGFDFRGLLWRPVVAVIR